MSRSSAAYAQQPANESALVARYRPLIDKVTRRVASRTGGAVQAEELFSAAALGLLGAAQRYDSNREASFETFAEHRIRGAVLDELRAMDPLPRRLRADTVKLKKDTTALEHRLGREASVEEIAEASGKSPDEVVSLLQVSKPTESLSDVLSGTLQHDGPDAENSLMRKQLIIKLTKSLEALQPRTAMLMSLHYVEGLTYKEIGSVLNISEVRVCQIHKEALASLKAMLHQEEE